MLLLTNRGLYVISILYTVIPLTTHVEFYWTSKNGVTALHIASHAGHNEVVRSLIFRDANVNITDEVSCSIIFKLVYCNFGLHFVPVFQHMVSCSTVLLLIQDYKRLYKIANTELKECLVSII